MNPTFENIYADIQAIDTLLDDLAVAELCDDMGEFERIMGLIICQQERHRR